MIIHALAEFEFIDLKGALFIVILVTALIGWIRNLRCKNRIGDAGGLLTSKDFGRGSDQNSGEILGVERFQSVTGLPGYPPPTLGQFFLGGGSAMELIFTKSALIFCDPSASNHIKQTQVSLEDVVSVRSDYNDGSTLIIKCSFGTIRCETQGTFGAKPAKKFLDGILNAYGDLKQAKQGDEDAIALITKFSDSANRRTISQATASDQVDLPRKNTKTTMEHDDTFEKKQKQRLQALHSYITLMMSGMNDDALSRAEGASGTLQDDSGSDAYDFDFALNRLSHEANALGEIEEALHRLQLGTYGICEKSGQKIPDPRLEALPFARHTVEVQSMIENQQEITKTEPLHDNHKALTLDDDTLLGISSDMPTEEIRTHLNKLFRKYSNRVSHDDPKIADKARERLMKIGEARARHIDFH